MKKIILFSLLVFAFGAQTLSAQYIVRPGLFENTGVSNQGMLAGYEEQGGSYFMWNPDTNDYYPIGGAAPGQGVGGQAKFSADGSLLSGTNYIEQTLSTDWQRNVLPNFDFIFNHIAFPEGQAYWGFAAGQSLTWNGNGIVLRTVDGGLHWAAKWVDTNHRGIETMSFPTMYTGYIGGWNDLFAKTTDGGNEWTEMNPAGMDDVYYYSAMAFKDDMNGVVGAFLEDGIAIYATQNGGETWTTGSGLVGVPAKICHAGGDTYFLVTNGGIIQKSVDNGLTWTTVHTTSTVLAGISFQNETNGIATGETFIYKTIDGGTSWTEQNVSEGAILRDVKWLDDSNLVLVGTPDLIFGSTNGGETWTWDNETIFNGNPALYAVAITDQNIHVCGSQGNFYRKSLISSHTVAEMSQYDTASGEWTALGNLGQTVDFTTSAGFYISGDGETVVGNAWADPNNGNGYTMYAHGFARNATEGTIDLGSLFANENRSSRGNAVNHDGSVIVGYQDLNGPWKSAVWRKNPAGGYFQNEYLLVDPLGSATDEYNQLGECSFVTPDGTWIGGEGDYANGNQPWIWSESTGVINLGDLSEGMGTGRVGGISPDGNMVVGWFTVFGWGAAPIPFIWTPNEGIRNINTYVTETLGIDTNNNDIWIPNNMSANGKYISGWGINPTVGEFGEIFTFRLELPELGLDEFSANTSEVFPNPVQSNLNITAAQQIDRVEVYNVRGQMLLSENSQTSIKTIDLSALSSGIYFVKTYADGALKTHKIVKQ